MAQGPGRDYSRRGPCSLLPTGAGRPPSPERESAIGQRLRSAPPRMARAIGVEQPLRIASTERPAIASARPERRQLRPRVRPRSSARRIAASANHPR
jgi:hypothetical protein